MSTNPAQESICIKYFFGPSFQLLFSRSEIAALSLQHANVPKEPIICTFTTLKDMAHSLRNTFGDLETFNKGNMWTHSLKPSLQDLGQGNGDAPSIWEILSTPILNWIREAGHGAVLQNLSGGILLCRWLYNNTSVYRLIYLNRGSSQNVPERTWHLIGGSTGDMRQGQSNQNW